MGLNRTNNYIESWLEELQSEGRYSFTLEELKRKFEIAPEALRKSLQRLLNKGKVARLRKEFYLIVPPEYSSRGILPTLFYVNGLMKFLNRDYYVGLLSAAMLHGAAHQQPQDFYIVTKRPFLRDIRNKKINIRFSIKKNWNKEDIIEKKTDTGYIKVASPELTALDIVFFLESIGGLNRVATVLDELAENINPEKLASTAKRYGQITSVQRLGYLLEKTVSQKDKTEPLYEWLKTQTFYTIYLKPGKKSKNMQTKNRWKVIKNFSPESDL